MLRCAYSTLKLGIPLSVLSPYVLQNQDASLIRALFLLCYFTLKSLGTPEHGFVLNNEELKPYLHGTMDLNLNSDHVTDRLLLCLHGAESGFFFLEKSSHVN